MNTVQGELPPPVKAVIKGAYALQKLRVSTGNRVCSAFRCKLGMLKGMTYDEAELDKNEKLKEKILKMIYDDFKVVIAGGKRRKRSIIEDRRVTDDILEDTIYDQWKTLTPSILISDLSEYLLVRNYHNLLTTEKKSFTELGTLLTETNDFYNAWLKHVHGIGPAMAGVLLSTINIYKAKYPSSIHKLAGYDVVTVTDKDGNEKQEGRNKTKQHLIKVKYIDKEGVEQEKDSITFKPFLKTKMKVIETSFLRSGNQDYRTVYDNYKNRLLNQPRFKDQEKVLAHVNNMALRYMGKRFLTDLYVAWKKHENLPVSEEYYISKLGMTPHGQ
jgi:hypothetical protein